MQRTSSLYLLRLQMVCLVQPTRSILTLVLVAQALAPSDPLRNTLAVQHPRRDSVISIVTDSILSDELSVTTTAPVSIHTGENASSHLHFGMGMRSFNCTVTCQFVFSKERPQYLVI